MAKSQQEEWRQPDWLAHAHQWISDALSRRSIDIVGKISQYQVRPWSMVLLVPTEEGNFYFKVSSEGLAFETELTHALYKWRPNQVPEVVAHDSERRWMLTADGGMRLREKFNSGLAVENWSTILSTYADLQKDLGDRVEEMLSFGVHDRRLAVLPDLYLELLADRDSLLIERPGGITLGEHQRLRAAGPKVAEMCRQLDGYGIPASIHHNDLHDGNIFVKDGRYLFFDWGDSSVSHPFFSLRTVFVSIENTFGLDENDPLFDKLASSYLESWIDHEPAEKLRRGFELARRLWSISSAIKYWTIFGQLGPDKDYFPEAVPGLMQEFLELNPEF
jgi:hypothetical protein